MPDRIVLIACNTLKAEIEHICALRGKSYPTIWLESQLHNEPDHLAERLQHALDGIEGADTVLLGFGNCGNVVQGLAARDFELIVPRLDDCISLLFGSQQVRTAYSEVHRSIFLTQGWMDDGHNIIDEYQRTQDKYGEETARSVFASMYRHYRSMTYLDTGLYDIAALKNRTHAICDMLELEQLVVTATLSYLEELLMGPWPENRFVHVAPGGTVPSAPFREL
ncbi:MAG TPA: hypothetical protein DCP91_07935 [Eggerthellaceae bacterium]|nr:hypothetical protein [Eggerthellaceae bacterium]